MIIDWPWHRNVLPPIPWLGLIALAAVAWRARKDNLRILAAVIPTFIWATFLRAGSAAGSADAAPMGDNQYALAIAAAAAFLGACLRPGPGAPRRALLTFAGAWAASLVLLTGADFENAVLPLSLTGVPSVLGASLGFLLARGALREREPTGPFCGILAVVIGFTCTALTLAFSAAYLHFVDGDPEVLLGAVIGGFRGLFAGIGTFFVMLPFVLVALHNDHLRKGLHALLGAPAPMTVMPPPPPRRQPSAEPPPLPGR